MYLLWWQLSLLLLLLPPCLPSSPCPFLPPSLPCSCSPVPGGPLVSCTGLNSTLALGELQGSLFSLHLSRSDFTCIHTQHLQHLDLKHLTVTNSGLTQVLCPGASFSSLPSLTSLDLSNNSLRSLLPASLHSLPPSLSSLALQGNPLACSSDLAWLAEWATNSHLANQLSGVTCYLESSPSRTQAPVLQAMQYYTERVSPSCPPACSCSFWHWTPPTDSSPEPAYTVLVNCSGQGLTTFPSLPGETTVLDLSYNLLDQAAYDDLEVVGMNYQGLESLILSHNLLTTIHMKLFRLLRLFRAFKADHNLLTELPYDFSQLLQKNTNLVTLGNNLWQCSCNSEITDTSLQRKIQDQAAVTCGEGSVPDSIVGRRLADVDHALLCPPSEKAEQQELALKIVCVVLASLIVAILTKLLYDYWQYRNRGKLPWIVYRMP